MTAPDDKMMDDNHAGVFLNLSRQNPHPVLRLNSDLRVIFANTAATDFLESIEAASHDESPASPHSRWSEQLRRISGSIEKDTFNITVGQKSYHFDVIPETAEDARMVINLFGVDTTEIQVIQQQLVQSAKLATMGELASGIIHELNQPLSVIRMASEAAIMELQSDMPDPAFLQGKLDGICAHTTRMADIINLMRQFGRKDTDAPDNFNAADVIVGAISIVRDQFRVSGIELICDVPQNSYFPMLGHALQLEQVLVNLLGNARDSVLEKREQLGSDAAYTPTISLRYSECHQKNTLAIWVSDNGVGIPEEIVKTIFDPFVTTKHDSLGTGLGLSISNRIVDSMGGSLTVSNTLGGAQFCIHLPVFNERRSPFSLALLEQINGAPEIEGADDPGSPRIMIVDDEKEILLEMEEYLNGQDYDVIIAHDGAEALKLFSCSPVDVLITDIAMPNRDGYQLIRDIQELTPEQRIIVVTGHTDIDDNATILGLGADVVLRKPLSLWELKGAISALLSNDLRAS